MNSLIGDADRIFSDWSEALETIAGNESTGGEKVFTTGCVMIFRSADGWESWQFTGDPDNDLYDAEKWQEYATGGSGGNTCNVTEEIPLESGYYTLATACCRGGEETCQGTLHHLRDGTGQVGDQTVHRHEP